ncbi:MAG: hypothetical protein ACKOFD_02115 [Actinomycetota bacterium]
MSSSSTGGTALLAMRRARRKNRVAELEWFEALYRVYLAAIIGGGIILFLSGLVDDSPVSQKVNEQILTYGAPLLGLLPALAIFLGLRSGTQGGPVAVEEAEVRHVLLAPVPYSQALRQPAIQRLRSAAFMGGLVGAIAGQLADRRLPGEFRWWVVLGATFGACTVSLFTSSALVAHGLRLKRWLSTVIGSVVVAVQVFDVAEPHRHISPIDALSGLVINGPFNWQHAGVQPQHVIAVLVCVLIAGAGIVLSSRLSVEALARRSSLVSQLKFAVTLQDIRTVVLLRRQLSQEHMRPTPWFKWKPRKRIHVVINRGIRSVAHFPARRLGRIAILSSATALALVYTFDGTTPLVVVAGVLTFIIGLDVIEPLSQEVDQPNYSDSYPRERCLTMAQHLVVPSLMLVPCLIIGIITAFVARPEVSTLAMSVLVGVPAALGGLSGAAINAVKGAPDPVGESNEGLYMPPEVSGMTTVIRAVWPVVVSVIGSLPMVAALAATRTDSNPFTAAARVAIGVLLVLSLVPMWVRKRDDIHLWWRQTLEGSKAQAAQKGRY